MLTEQAVVGTQVKPRRLEGGGFTEETLAELGLMEKADKRKVMPA